MWENKIEQTVEMLQQGMDLAVARRRLIASNVANAETPGYKAVDVDFQRFLQEAQGSMPGAVPAVMARTHPGHLGAAPLGRAVPLRWTLEPLGEVKADGNTVNLEEEMAKTAENQIRFQSLTVALNRYFSFLKEAISEGGRG